MSTINSLGNLPPEYIEQISDPQWRLRNIYWIVDADANVIPFVPNDSQETFLGTLHTRNIILKSRQRGFSTVIQLMALDQAIFNENYSAGIIADNLDNAAVFLKRIEFAYDHMPEAIRMAVTVAKRNESVIEFSNGSSIRVDTSYRSGTLQFLHVSEFGKICAKYPDKALEIIKGTLPALAPTGMGFIESTAEGHEGYFFEMCKEAEDKALTKARLTPVDFKYHFYSWWDEDRYRIDPTLIELTFEEKEYCTAIELKIDRKLEPERWAWYWATRRKPAMGEGMLQEYPSVAEEAFFYSIEGRYYPAQFTAIRAEGRIGTFPHLPDRPVYTFWDIGQGDETAIWFMQYVGSRFRWIRYIEASGEAFNYFVLKMQDMGYTWGVHYLPHDAEHTRQLGMINKSAIEMLEDLAPGWHFEIVDRIPDITVGIQQVRMMLPICEFDKAGTAVGIARLEAYRKEWNERTQAWKQQPFHGPESNAADAIRQAAQKYAAGELRAPAPMRDKTKRPQGSWRTA